MKNETKKKAAPAAAVKKGPGMKGKIIACVAVVVLIVGVGAYLFCPCTQKMIKKMKQTGPVVAEINGEKIRLSELEEFKNESPQLAEIPMEMIYPQLLDLYVNQKVLLKKACEMKLKDDPTVQKLIKDAKRQLVIQAYLAKQIEARMTPDRLKMIYNADVQSYVPVDEIHARHILVNTETEAKDIIVQLNAGAKFETLAEKYSIDENSKERSGDLGYFRKDMMIPEFGNAAFAVKKGTYSKQPIKTPFGYHIVYVEDIRKSAPPAFEDVQDALQKRFAELMAPEVLKEERAMAKVQLFNIFEAPQAEVVEEIVVEEDDK